MGKKKDYNAIQHCSVEKRSCYIKANLFFDKDARLDDKGISETIIFLEWDIVQLILSGGMRKNWSFLYLSYLYFLLIYDVTFFFKCSK